MSSAPSATERALPMALPQPLTSVCAALAVIGVLAFGFGLVSDPQTAWLSFHANFIFYATLAQAGVLLSCIFVIVGAKWPGPLRRILEGFGAWVPVTLVLAVVGIFGGDYLFEWKREGAAHGKEVWLNSTRVYVTDLGILGLITLLTMSYLKASVRPTLNGVQGATGFAGRMIERWTAGWRGDEEERAASAAKTLRLAVAIAMTYAMGYSLLIFDQVMSMEQTWYSNLFGAFVSWGGILSAVAACALAAVLLRNTPGVGEHITKPRLHDIGKMLFAFSIFWMYLFFSQYLVIYYGNMPEETQYLYDRLGPQFVIDKGFTPQAWSMAWVDWDWSWERLSSAYGWLSMATWACCWIVPFWVLLGAAPKKTPWILGPVAGVVLLGFWFERNLLVWPSVVKDAAGGFGQILGLVQLGVAAGFLGAFVLVFLTYSRLFPTLAVPEDG